MDDLLIFLDAVNEMLFILRTDVCRGRGEIQSERKKKREREGGNIDEKGMKSLSGC